MKSPFAIAESLEGSLDSGVDAASLEEEARDALVACCLSENDLDPTELSGDRLWSKIRRMAVFHACLGEQRLDNFAEKVASSKASHSLESRFEQVFLEKSFTAFADDLDKIRGESAFAGTDEEMNRLVEAVRGGMKSFDKDSKEILTFKGKATQQR